MNDKAVFFNLYSDGLQNKGHQLEYIWITSEITPLIKRWMEHHESGFHRYFVFKHVKACQYRIKLIIYSSFNSIQPSKNSSSTYHRVCCVYSTTFRLLFLCSSYCSLIRQMEGRLTHKVHLPFSTYLKRRR